MRVVNIGRFPPPVGGVSYFLKRLKPYIDDSKIHGIFYDVSGLNCDEKRELGVICCSYIRCFIDLLFMKKSIIVFHSNRLSILLAIQILSTKHKIVIFTHGESILKVKQKGKLHEFLLKKIDYFVTPTEILFSSMKKIYPKYEAKIRHIPFILFPKEIEPIAHNKMLELRSKSEYLVAGYAYDLTFYNNQDLYGVDMMIEVIKRLKVEYIINVSLILLMPKCTNKQYFNEVLSNIRDNNLDNNILIIDEPLNEASSLFDFVDVYIRPTNTDGDSFAVWESLYVNTPVVASDAAQRPKGCSVFKTRDNEHFYEVLLYTLLNLKDIKKQLEDININGNESGLIDFFESIVID